MHSFWVVVLQCSQLIRLYISRFILCKLSNKVCYRVLLNIHMHLLAGLGRYFCRRKPKIGVALNLNVSCSNRKCGRLCLNINNDLWGNLEIFLLYLSKLSRPMRPVYLACSSEVLQHRDNPCFQKIMLEGLCRKTLKVYRWTRSNRWLCRLRPSFWKHNYSIK